MLESPSSKLLVFYAGENACALRVEDVAEVVLIAQLAQLAGQPPLIEGFLNLRGQMVPVMPLWRLLNLPAVPPSLHSPILIIRTPLLVAGFLVERVDGVEDEFAVNAEPSTRLSFNQCAELEAQVGGFAVTVLSAERLLLEQERQCVVQFAAQAQSRLSSLTEAGS